MIEAFFNCQCDNQVEMIAEFGLGVTTFKLSNLQKEIRSGNSHHISTFKFLKEKKLLRVHFSQLSSITSNGLAAETTTIYR